MLDYRLSRHKLKRLAEHKYSVEGTTLLDAHFQHFWRATVEVVPLWCAPNSITLVGLIINALSTGLLVLYSPDARGSPPGYSYILCAIGLFLYQTLDAIDGKQARRTQSSTPLVELFDHGCDSMSIVLVIVSFSIMLQLGDWPGLMYLECFGSMFIFYAAHWQTYCSGTLKFGLFDVTEGQVSIIILFVMTSILGTSFWTTEMPWLGLETRMIPVLVSLTGTGAAAYNYFRIILIRGGIGRNGSTVAGTSVLSPILPIALLITLGVTLWMKSTTQVFDRHTVLYVMSFGMASAKITNKLVVAHMSRSEMELLDRSLIGPGLLFLNQYFDTFIDEYFLLWVFFIFCSIDLVWYSYNICYQICDHLNIQCFHITPLPPGPPPSSSATTPPASHATSGAAPCPTVTPAFFHHPPSVSASPRAPAVPDTRPGGASSGGHTSLLDRCSYMTDGSAKSSNDHSRSSSSSDSAVDYSTSSSLKRVTRSSAACASVNNPPGSQSSKNK